MLGAFYRKYDLKFFTILFHFLVFPNKQDLKFEKNPFMDSGDIGCAMCMLAPPMHASTCQMSSEHMLLWLFGCLYAGCKVLAIYNIHSFTVEILDVHLRSVHAYMRTLQQN